MVVILNVLFILSQFLLEFINDFGLVLRLHLRSLQSLLQILDLLPCFCQLLRFPLVSIKNLLLQQDNLLLLSIALLLIEEFPRLKSLHFSLQTELLVLELSPLLRVFGLGQGGDLHHLEEVFWARFGHLLPRLLLLNQELVKHGHEGLLGVPEISHLLHWPGTSTSDLNLLTELRSLLLFSFS